MTLIQCHKGYEEEASRSCKWLHSIKSSNKRIMEFPLTVNLKNVRSRQNLDKSGKTFDLSQPLLLLLNVNFSYCCIYVNYMASPKKNATFPLEIWLISFLLLCYYQPAPSVCIVRHYWLPQSLSNKLLYSAKWLILLQKSNLKWYNV